MTFSSLKSLTLDDPEGHQPLKSTQRETGEHQPSAGAPGSVGRCGQPNWTHPVCFGTKPSCLTQPVLSVGILQFDSAAEGDRAGLRKQGVGGKMATGDDSPSST